MKIHLRTVGCRLNQSEIDTLARQFRGQGHEIVDDPALADQIVVNTCAVTQDATRGSRHLIRDLNRANPSAQVNVTGCYAQISPDEIAVLPGVARVINNLEKDNLVEKLTGHPVEPFDLEPLSRENKLGAFGRTRAFVKVQDGCDNACTFCVTTIARGAGRSRPLSEILYEIRYLHSIGYQEAVITGVQLGSYGHDLGDRDGLVHLIRSILSETDLPRLRLYSLEPWDLSAGFFELWANPRLCRHLHLPLQSGCDATLRRMRRRTNQQSYRSLLQTARQYVPDMRITTDVIVGFPGETNDEFTISEAFIHEMEFAGLHIFRYSKRPGTAAARMRGHIDEAVKKARSVSLIDYSEGAERRYSERFIGQMLTVLWEHITGAAEAGFVNVGYTDNYIRVRSVFPRVLTDYITPAHMDTWSGDFMQVTPDTLAEVF
jgi:threonylcarbamoyladenosine tRNA methylthiotransferase MtaB